MPHMARRPDERERVLGPYPHHGGWRVIVVGADGRRRRRFFAQRPDADQFIAITEKKISTLLYTTDSARDEFVKALRLRKLSERTIEGYVWALRTFWPKTKALRGLSKEACEERYRELAADFAADSHLNALKMCRTFLGWCVGEGWLAGNPLEKVKGIGKHKKGKTQLRLDEGRKFYAHALKLANEGDPGAIASLMCLLLTLRSESEALAVTVRDLDDDGRLLVIDEGKTENSRRTHEVPEELQAPLKALAAGKGPGDYLFRRRDRKWLWDEVKKLCQGAGVPRVCPHALRGMHGTFAKQAGATSRLVADALGHASVRVTEDHYIAPEAAQEEKRRALSLIRGGVR